MLRNYQLDVINKTRQAFRDGFKRPLITLPCGAGKTVCFAYMAAESQKRGNNVWFVVHRKELLDQTLETFERFNIPLNTITVGMVITMGNHLEDYPKPDLIIFDESHFSACKTWDKIISAFPEALIIIGLTATPTRLDGKPLGNIYDTLIQGVTTRELINMGYLCPYNYYAPSVANLEGLKRKGSDFDTTQAAELFMKPKIYGDIIAHYNKLAHGKQAVCYCSTIIHSKKMAEEFVLAGINAVHFDGDTPKNERTEIVKKFKANEIMILCNVDLISVGFDCPDIDCCIMLRPTQSTALYIQQAGRALRPRKGKTAIILDHAGNVFRHGMPDENREWSLQEKLKPRQEYNVKGELTIKQCQKCLMVFESAPVCPFCGAAVEKTRKELENIKKIELEEIKEYKKAKVSNTVQNYTTEWECKSMAELMAYAKITGRKPGWAYYKGKIRGFVK